MANSSFVFSSSLDTRQLERDAAAAFRRINKQKISLDIDSSGLNKVSSGLGRINTQASEFNKSLEASNARVLAFGASVGAISVLTRGFAGLISSAIEVEKILTDINSVLKESSSGLDRFSASVFTAAKNTGQSFKTAAEAALELSRQGLNTEQTIKRLNSSLILSRLGGLSAAEAVETVTAALNSFGKVVITDTQLVNKFSTVAAKFFVSEKDLAEAIKRVGSSAQDAGVGIDEFIGLVTSAQQVTARGGAVIGNSLKTIFTRLQRSTTIDELDKIGVAVRDLEGNTLPAIQILESLAGKLNGLSQPQQAFVEELTAGVFQINQLKSILGDLNGEYSFYAAAVKASNEATDEAIKRNEELNKTFDSQFTVLKNNLTQISAILGKDILAPLGKGLGTGSSILSSIFSISEGEKAGNEFASGLAKGIGNLLSGPGAVVITTAAIGLFAKLGSFAGQALKSTIDLVTSAEDRRKVQAQIVDMLQKEPQLMNQIMAGATSIEEVEKRILSIIKQKTLAQQQFSSIAATGANAVRGGGLKGSGVKFNGSGFTPSFADPIRSAIEREKKAGVNPRDIYLDSDARLKSPSNPMGVMVANRRDEPLGGYQGVDRALSMGQNPKRAGMGGVPNFVESSPGVGYRVLTGRGRESRFVSKEQSAIINVGIKQYRESLEKNAEGAKETAKILKKQAKETLSLVNIVGGYTKVMDDVAVEYKQEKEEIKAARTATKKANVEKISAAKKQAIADKNIEKEKAKLQDQIQKEYSQKSGTGLLFPGIEDFDRSKLVINRNGGVNKATQAQFEATREVQSRNASTGQKFYNEQDAAALKASSVFRINKKESDFLSNLASAAEKAKTGGAFSQQETEALKQEGYRQARSNPIFTGLSNSDIKNNPKARRELNKLATDFQNQFVDAQKEALTGQALDNAFAGRSNMFATRKGDLRAFEKELGISKGGKLSEKQQLAFNMRQSQARDSRSSRIGNAALLTSVGASLAAPAFGDGIGSGIVSGAATGLSVGALSGNPYLMAAGAVVGAGTGAYSASRQGPERELAKRSEVFQKLSAEFETSSNAAQQYIQTQSKLNDLIKDGSASTKDIEALNSTLTDVFSNITDQNLKRDILDAGSNVKLLGEAMGKFAQESAKNLAAESIPTLVTSAKVGARGRGFFSDGVFKNKDLGKIGQSLVTGGLIDKDSSKSLNDLAASGNFAKVREELVKINPALSELVDNLDVTTVLSAATAWLKTREELTKTQKVQTDYLVELSKAQKEFIRLSNEMLNQSRQLELDSESATRVKLGGISGNLQNTSFGLTESATARIQSRVNLAGISQGASEKQSGLNDALRTKLSDFAGSSSASIFKEYLTKINDRTADPRGILKELLESSKSDVSKLGKKPEEEIRKLTDTLSDHDKSLQELARATDEATQMEGDRARSEQEAIGRRNRVAMLGGTSFGGLNMASIQAGRAASTSRFGGEKLLSENTPQFNRDNIRNNTQSFRLLEAQGIIDKQSLFPGLPTSSKDIKTVKNAFEGDTTDKLNQFVASSLSGLLSEASLSQTGVGLAGRDLDKNLRKNLSRSSSVLGGGKADFAGAAEFTKARLPDFGAGGELKRQLLELFDEAARIQAMIPQSAEDKAKSVTQTDEQKQISYIEKLISGFKGEDIAKNTAETAARISALKDIFAAQSVVLRKGEDANSERSKLGEISKQKSAIERKIEEQISSSTFDKNKTALKYIDYKKTGVNSTEVVVGSELASKLKKSSGLDPQASTVLRSKDSLNEVFSIIANSKNIGEAKKSILAGGEKTANAIDLISGGKENKSQALDVFLSEFSSTANNVGELKLQVDELNKSYNSQKTAVEELTGVFNDAQKVLVSVLKPTSTANTTTANTPEQINRANGVQNSTGILTSSLNKFGSGITIEKDQRALTNVNSEISRMNSEVMRTGTMSKSQGDVLDLLRGDKEEISNRIKSQTEMISSSAAGLVEKTGEAIKGLFTDISDNAIMSIKKELALKVSVMMGDGKVDEKESSELTQMIRTVVEQFYNEKIKPKEDSSVKDNGGIPRPPSSAGK